MLHPSRMRMVRLPPRQLNQRLILFGLLALEAVHPGQPPVPTFTLFIAAHVTLIALAVRHLKSLLPLKISHSLQRYRQRAAGPIRTTLQAAGSVSKYRYFRHAASALPIIRMIWRDVCSENGLGSRSNR